MGTALLHSDPYSFIYPPYGGVGAFLEVRCQRLKIAHLGDAPSRARLLIFEAFPDLVVLGTLIEPCQHLPRCRGYIRTLIIIPSELLNRIPGVKPHDGNELYLIVVERPAEELDSLVSRDLLISYTREDFFLEKPLVLVGVLGVVHPCQILPITRSSLACNQSSRHTVVYDAKNQMAGSVSLWPIFTRVRGRGILRTSALRRSKKFAPDLGGWHHVGGKV